MTSANVLQTQTDPGQILNAKTAKTSGIAGVNTQTPFSSFLQGTASQSAAGTGNFGNELPATGSVKNNSCSKRDILQAETKTVADKVSESSDAVAETKEVLVDTVAEKLDVDESELLDAMEALGMTAFDLLDPQKLAQLYMQVSGETSQAELLVDSRFVDLMQAVSGIGEDLMDALGVASDEMDELIAQMDFLEEPVAVEMSLGQEAVGINENQIPKTEAAEGQIAGQQEELNDEIRQGKDTAGQNAQALPQEETEALSGANVSNEESESREGSRGQTGEHTQTPVQRSGARMTQTELTGNSQGAAVFTDTMEAQLSTSAPAGEQSFSSLNPLDLIEQIAQNVRVNLSQESSSMEMQLNPENLGRIYLQVSAREGTVHATIAAQNEAVKVALEAQVAELRESLNQSGVKVDAVEVTVASHEFEKNLEQNNKRQQEEGQRQQEQISRRRNLDLTMIGDLEGELTEEEALVAQIMQDNGNSVDLTA